MMIRADSPLSIRWREVRFCFSFGIDAVLIRDL